MGGDRARAEETPAGRRTGRRRGGSDTREAIERAARTQFAAKGFDGATVRAIAAEAGVDPALIAHFFGSKRGLFVAVLRPPEDPSTIAAAIEGPVDSLGERLAAVIARTLGDPDLSERLEALVRTAASEPEAARVLRDTIGTHLMTPVAEQIDADDPALRANLVGATMAGLVLARRILAIEPLASADLDRVAELVAAGLQAYLTRD